MFMLDLKKFSFTHGHYNSYRGFYKKKHITFFSVGLGGRGGNRTLEQVMWVRIRIMGELDPDLHGGCGSGWQKTTKICQKQR